MTYHSYSNDRRCGKSSAGGLPHQMSHTGPRGFPWNESIVGVRCAESSQDAAHQSEMQRAHDGRVLPGDRFEGAGMQMDTYVLFRSLEFGIESHLREQGGDDPDRALERSGRTAAGREILKRPRTVPAQAPFRCARRTPHNQF